MIYSTACLQKGKRLYSSSCSSCFYFYLVKSFTSKPHYVFLSFLELSPFLCIKFYGFCDFKFLFRTLLLNSIDG
jgi:hypothetical protein